MKSQMKTFLWKMRADLNPWWKTCSSAATRPFSPHNRMVRLPLCGKGRAGKYNSPCLDTRNFGSKGSKSTGTSVPFLLIKICRQVMKSRNYLFLWLVEVFHNVVHSFPDSLLDLPCIRLCEMMESTLAEVVGFKCCITLGGWSFLAWHFSSHDWTEIWTRSTLSHPCALAENTSCDPHSPVSCCSQVQLLVKADFRDVRLMCPRVPAEISSARRQLTAATSSSELPSEGPVFPRTAKWAGRLGSISYHKFCCLLLPHLISPCSKERDYYLSTVKRRHWERQRVHHRANSKQGRQDKLISLQLLPCTKPCFRINPPAHRSFSSPAVGSCLLLCDPGEEGKDSLVFFPVREVMLSLRVTVGDFCWGGVRHCFASSSSDVEDTSSPMRILSRLPSSTPLPSHRPQGNLQDKHSSATRTAQPALKAGGQLAPSKRCWLAGKTLLPENSHKAELCRSSPCITTDHPQKRGNMESWGHTPIFMVHILFSTELFSTCNHDWYAAFKSVVMITNQIPREFPPSWGCDISSYSGLTPHFTAVPLDPIDSPNEIHAHVHTPSHFIPCPPTFPKTLWPALRSGAHLPELQFSKFTFLEKLSLLRHVL